MTVSVSARAAGRPAPAASAPSARQAVLEHSRLRWDPEYRRFRRWQYVSTGVMLSFVALNVAGGSIMPDVRANWTRRNVFDDAVQGALRLESKGAREAINLTSDVGWYASAAFAVVIDPLIVWAYHKSPELSWQMWLITVQSMSLTGVLGSLAAYAGRERPFVDEVCHGPGAPTSGLENCASAGRLRSFFSGHAASTFTAAAASCAHHLFNDIYGRAGDISVCAAGLTLGTSVGLFRIMADRHYLTDVMLGAAVGLTSGFVVPWLLHYRKGARKPQRAADGSFATFGPLVTSGGLGVSYLGAF